MDGIISFVILSVFALGVLVAFVLGVGIFAWVWWLIIPIVGYVYAGGIGLIFGLGLDVVFYAFISLFGSLSEIDLKRAIQNRVRELPSVLTKVAKLTLLRFQLGVEFDRERRTGNSRALQLYLATTRKWCLVSLCILTLVFIAIHHIFSQFIQQLTGFIGVISFFLYPLSVSVWRLFVSRDLADWKANRRVFIHKGISEKFGPNWKSLLTYVPFSHNF